MIRRPVVGVSLKAYLGLQDTLKWAKDAAVLVGGHPAVVSGAVEFIVFPSTPFLSVVNQLFDGTKVVLGAQDVSRMGPGAHTGENVAEHLRDVGTAYVEIGHAERKSHFFEDGPIINQKLGRAMEAGLAPLLCVGEEDNSGVVAGAEVCIRQIDDALGVRGSHSVLGSLVVAYEPVWAIGADEPAPEHHVLGVFDHIRRHLDRLTGGAQARVVYGGSAGPGLIRRISPPLDGLFLGRFAHDVRNIAQVLDELALIKSE